MNASFIFNLSLMLTTFFIIGQVFRKHDFGLKSSVRIKIAGGLFFGLQGLLLMYFGVQTTSASMMDLRHLSIVTAAFFGGMPSSLAASLLVAGGRLILLGISREAVMAFLFVLLIGLGCGLLSRLAATPFLRYMIMNLFSLLMVTGIINIIVPDRTLVWSIAQSYWLISLSGGLLAFFIAQYIEASNANFRKLHESEARYRRLLETSPDAIFVVLDRVIALVNDKALELLRALTPEDVVGKPIDAFVHPEDLPIALEQVRQLLDRINASGKDELRLIRCDGTLLEMEIVATLTDYDGKPAILGNARDITERKQMERKLHEALAELEELSNKDGLTQIANRRHFDEIFEREWGRALRHSAPLSMILIDIDSFKAYNDTYGHLSGDECLKKVAETIRSTIKRPTDFAARYGGEEFVIILTDTDAEGALRVGERIRRCVKALRIPHDQSAVSDHVTVSQGIVSIIPSPGMDKQDLIGMADKALYRAKDEGRNRSVVYSEQM